MRHFHYKRNPDFCPTINIDRLWSLAPEGVYEKAAAGNEQAPVIDVTKLVRIYLPFLYHLLIILGRVTLKFLAKEYYQAILSLSKLNISVKRYDAAQNYIRLLHSLAKCRLRRRSKRQGVRACSLHNSSYRPLCNLINRDICINFALSFNSTMLAVTASTG